MLKPPRILMIAGSDSGGGAGIQADIKTVTMLGGFATTAITALTAQNTMGVQGIVPVAPEFVVQQMHSVISDIGVDVIKSGMLFSHDIIHAVADYLERAVPCPFILDPVMVATSGAVLLKADAQSALLTRLMPLATLITPNIPEANVLCDMDMTSRDDMQEAARRLMAKGAKAVLVKGGHLESDIISDLLWTNDTAHWFESPRIHTRHTHGTGCTLASAIATFIGHGKSLPDAVKLARDYVHQAILHAPQFGHGNGPLGHHDALIKPSASGRG